MGPAARRERSESESAEGTLSMVFSPRRGEREVMPLSGQDVRAGAGKRDSVRCLLGKETSVMKSFVNRVKSFLRDEEGATATEYAVMLALIIVIALGAISALGQKVSSTFTQVENTIP